VIRYVPISFFVFLQKVFLFRAPLPPKGEAIQDTKHGPEANFSDHPYTVAAFVVNSEPHVGTRPSFRVWGWLINAKHSEEI
jgi:hypothetical protein